MKKSIFTSLVLIATFIIMAFTRGSECIVLSKNSSGARFGHSGDPASKGKDCTACHSDEPTAQKVADWISSDIPPTGYVPKTTYMITAKATAAGVSRFGFQVTPQNSSGTFLGTLSVIKDNLDTKLTASSPNYISNTSLGSSGTDEKTWTFNWTAPAQGSGPVTFYGAFNITNSDGGTTGDKIMLSTLTVEENQNTSIEDISTNNQPVSVHPNPAIDFFTIQSKSDLIGTKYSLTDQAGKLITTGKIDEEKTSVNISHLESGIYILKIDNQNNQSFKVIKK